MTKFTSAFAWLGGALFVGSLMFTAYALAVPWAQPRPLSASWLAAVGANACLLTMFALHHSLFSREAAKKAMGRLVAAHQIRPIYVWVASLLLIAVIWSWWPIGGQLYRVQGLAAWPLRLVQAAGVVLIARSVRAIDALELAGIRQPRQGATLTATGPYGLVRHPLYLGWILIVFGMPHMTGDRLVFAALTTVYLFVAMPWEERSLEQAFGEEYRRYRAQVRWRVLPYLY
ncbi:MAG: isoprenylcysteine carboxylmethyltransferase family protein [Vicinamibacterales bacterium]